MSDHEQNVSQDTMMFRAGSEGNHVAALTIATVCQALKEKGYNPINQLVGVSFIRRSYLYYQSP